MKKQKNIKNDIKKLRQNKQFLAIMVLFFVVLLFWITISLITSQTTEKIDPEIKKLSQPLTPVIDTAIFDQISEKKEYSQDELSSFTIFKVLTTRDGKTEKIVPIEVTIEDLEPKNTPEPRTSGSLLQDEVQNTPTNDEPSISPTSFPISIPEDETSNLGSQL